LGAEALHREGLADCLAQLDSVGIREEGAPDESRRLTFESQDLFDRYGCEAASVASVAGPVIARVGGTARRQSEGQQNPR
jgi:hypothetical protein